MGQTWRVTGQEERPVRTPRGYVDGVRVAFTTSAGIAGSVDVPADEYTADKVRALIEARVGQHDAVAALGSHQGGPGAVG